MIYSYTSDPRTSVLNLGMKHRASQFHSSEKYVNMFFIHINKDGDGVS